MNLWKCSVLAVALGLSLGLPGTSRAEDDKSAQDEIDRELGTMVKIPAPQLEVYYDGIDSSRYALVDVEYALDGKPLSAPDKLHPEQKDQLLFRGEVTPGDHAITAKLTFAEGGNKVFTYVQGSRFRLPGKWTLKAQRGLLLKLRTHVEVDDGQHDPKKRLELHADVEPKMLAKLDDGSMPEPMSPRGKDTATEVAAQAPAGKKGKHGGGDAEDEGDSPPRETRVHSTQHHGDEAEVEVAKQTADQPSKVEFASAKVAPETAPVVVADAGATESTASGEVPSVDAGVAAVAVRSEPAAAAVAAPASPAEGENRLPWLIAGGMGLLVALAVVWNRTRR